MEYRIHLEGADWARVSWKQDVEDAPSLWSPVLQIPGVSYHPRALDLPRTAWGCEEVAMLLADLQLSVPEHHAARYEGIATWEPKRKPLQHQPSVTRHLLESQRLLLADGMGLGKTGAAIQAVETVRRHVFHCTRPALIVGPLRARATWLRELLAMGAIEQESDLCVLESRDFDDACFRKGAPYYYAHFDVIEAWWSRIYTERPCVSVVDEVHQVKNAKTKRSLNTSIVVQTTPFRLLLTGTPVANHPNDLWALLTMLNGTKTWGSFLGYRRRYCGAQRDDFGWHDTEPTNIPELQDRLEPFYLRRELSDTGVELPPFTRELVAVKVPPGKTLAYRDDLRAMNAADIKRLVDEIINGASNPNALRLLGRLRKSTSAAKREATVELATSVLEQDGAVVVFCWQRETAIALQRLIDNRYTAITGDVPQYMRDARIAEFQVHGGAIVATYGVLQDSVTLTRSRVTIAHDLDYVPATLLQAEKRTHRISQDNACMSYWMVAHDMLDKILLMALKKKLANTEALFGLEQAVPEIDNAAPSLELNVRMAEAIADWKGW